MTSHTRTHTPLTLTIEDQVTSQAHILLISKEALPETLIQKELEKNFSRKVNKGTNTQSSLSGTCCTDEPKPPNNQQHQDVKRQEDE